MLLLCLLHGIALAVLCATALTILWFWGLAALLLVSLGIQLARVWHAPQQSFAIDAGQVLFLDAAGASWQAELLPQTVVTPYLVLLCVRGDVPAGYRWRPRHYRLLCRDSLPVDEFRRLCTTLRYAR